MTRDRVARFGVVAFTLVVVAQSFSLIRGRSGLAIDHASCAVAARCVMATAEAPVAGAPLSLWWLGLLVISPSMLSLSGLPGVLRRTALLGATASFVAAGVVVPSSGLLAGIHDFAIDVPRAYTAALFLLQVCLLALAYVLLTRPPSKTQGSPRGDEDS